MNKRTLPIFLIAVSFLSSCSGASINKTEAKKIVDNIFSALNNSAINYDKFSFTYKENKDDELSWISAVYDKKNRYYSCYTFTPIGKDNNGEWAYRVYEEWCYVKVENDKSENTYNVFKTNNEAMTYTKNETVWSDLEKNIITEFNAYLLSCLTDIENIIDSSEDASFKSNNENSITVNLNDDVYCIENNYLKNYSKKVDNITKSLNAQYSRVTLNYPTFSEN